MNQIIEIYYKLLDNAPTKWQRSIIKEVDWTQRLIGIKGARGIGKTTLMLQFIKSEFKDNLDEALYVSLDHLWFADNNLFDLADLFLKRGGKYLFIDEVHKYQNWSQEIKNIYDSLPDLKVIFTGSSLLEILNARADLSRRSVVYEMQGLSFREFLEYETELNFDQYSLSDIILSHGEISREILQKVKPLAWFQKYLEHGYYPFYMENLEAYHQKVREVINLILEIELPLLRNIETGYISYLKQLLFIISQSVPFTPNVTNLSKKIGIERTTLLKYLHNMDEVTLTKNLFRESKGVSKLQKPQKIYMENSNLMYSLNSENVNKGTLRETFFANQVGYKHKLNYTDTGDFLVDDKYTFEIGGKNKTNKQLKGITNSLIASDDIEYGFNDKIPLWLFGFLY